MSSESPVGPVQVRPNSEDKILGTFEATCVGDLGRGGPGETGRSM